MIHREGPPQGGLLIDIRTDRTSYVFGVNERGVLQHLHWGPPAHGRELGGRLRAMRHSSFDAELERETEEYTFWGGAFYGEPGLKARFADGVRDLRMKVADVKVDKDRGRDRLVLTLKDEHYALTVRLFYRVIPELDLIERHAEAVNGGSGDVVLEWFWSAAWPLPACARYRLTHVAGRWAGEYQLRETFLSEGKKVLESRSGFTGPHANPWFAVDDGRADEMSGGVWFGALGWSGNWKIVAELTSFGHARVSGGINDFDSEWRLRPGESFTTPVFTGGYSSEGFGGMSRALHRYQQEELLPSRKLRKVLYNSWEATYFDVHAEGQIELARLAAKMGVERFVVDDGWFGARNSDRAGLGDWTVSTAKFPDGLGALIREVKALGMDFGIWVEPEAVNPDSELYRRHPDWVYHFPNRPRTELRNQLLLNITKPEVKQFILDFMSRLLSEHDIAFIKWDMNRTITEPGLIGFPAEQQKEIWIRHVQSLYAIWTVLRAKFPHVEFETCAGGGARIDIGMLRFADQAWPSDNTDAFDRLLIQEGFSYAYHPRVMMCWVTDSPHGMNGRRLPLSFRFHSAMTGSLGIGGNLKHWTGEEIREAAEHIAVYKEIRPLVQDGRQYRLSSFRHAPLMAVQYVNADRTDSVVFAFRHAQQFGGRLPALRLAGLDAQLEYEVAVSGSGEPPVTAHGSTLMNAGVPLNLRGDFDSALIRVRAKDAP